MNLEHTARQNIKKLRRSYNWTLSELSRRSGINEYSLSRIETNDRQISLRDLQALARGFACDVGDLLGETPEPLFSVCPECAGRGFVPRLSAPGEGVTWKEGVL